MKQPRLGALLLFCCASTVSGYGEAETSPSPGVSAPAPPAPPAADAGAPAIVVRPAITLRPALEPRYASFRSLPAGDALKARAAKVALYRRLTAMPAATQAPVDLLAMARQEAATAFGTTRRADEVASFAPFLLMETLNAVQEDTKELAGARATLTRELETLRAIAARQPRRTPTAAQLTEERARGLVQRTSNLGLEYVVSANKNVAATLSALAAAGASAEQVKAVVQQEWLNALSTTVEMLSKLAAQFHETARNVIDNIKA